MAATHTAGIPAHSERASLIGWIIGGLLTAAVIAAVTIALWPASDADKARDDGEQLGQAVSQLYYADSAEEVDAALTEIGTAIDDSRDTAGDRIADQVAIQEDALARAADGYVGSRTTSDSFEADVYQAELEIAIDDLTSQASEFRSEGPEVRQAYWEGFEDGFEGQ